MAPPRIYADFNAIEYLDDEPSMAQMDLTGYGTLGSLARQGLRLTEGMALLLYEPNDIECEALAHFQSSRRDSWIPGTSEPALTQGSLPGSIRASCAARISWLRNLRT